MLKSEELLQSRCHGWRLAGGNKPRARRALPGRGMQPPGTRGSSTGSRSCWAHVRVMGQAAGAGGWKPTRLRSPSHPSPVGLRGCSAFFAANWAGSFYPQPLRLPLANSHHRSEALCSRSQAGFPRNPRAVAAGPNGVSQWQRGSCTDTIRLSPVPCLPCRVLV